jgi:hypothetical protein
MEFCVELLKYDGGGRYGKRINKSDKTILEVVNGIRSIRSNMMWMLRN